MSPRPDERIWVTLKPGWTPDPRLRWSIDGNAHTHRGHLHVSARRSELQMTVHAGDIADASPEARLWIDGFLCGQEAGLFEFLGCSPRLYDSHDEEDISRWMAWNERFRHRGWAPPLHTMPRPDPALDGVAAPQPWTYVAGRFRVWQDGAWTEADPQPEDAEQDNPGRVWPGTICSQRGYHELAVCYGSTTICESCHFVMAAKRHADDRTIPLPGRGMLPPSSRQPGPPAR
ncbi:MAG: hypothetical protein JO345_20480 [Streptosporangiaceae bacterium]|nr:hypothetical protein [Streptosporangiaceae bacterium]